jgi:hypothetical protein
LQLLYIFAATVLLPVASLRSLSGLNAEELALSFACCTTTVACYWSFTHAQRYWQTVQISAMIALAPVVAFGVMAFVTYLHWWPQVIHPGVSDGLSLFGMFVVVLSALSIQVFGQANQACRQSERRADRQPSRMPVRQD